MKTKHMDTTSLFIVLFATLIGGYLRISPVANLHLPLNDGGLFYAMTRDLQENRFLLPAFTTFNDANIPYAYPPLAFYLFGLISSLTGWPLIDLFRILPPVFSTLSIPVFYILARALLKDEAKSGIAAYLFAMFPAGYTLQVMGGGATRSLGFLFCLFTLWYAYRMYARGQARDVALTALFGALTCLSHPESAVRAAAGALLMYLFYGRNRRALIQSLLVASGVMALTAPWWATVLRNHGLEPFIAASRTGGHQLGALLAFLLGLFKGMLAEDIFLGFFGSMAALGFILQCARKDFFLPIWLIVTLLIEPRNSAPYLAVMVGMLASIGLVDFLFKIIRAANGSNPDREKKVNWAEELLGGGVSKVVAAYLLAFSIVPSYLAIQQTAQSLAVPPEDLEAVEWINENVPAGQRFIFIKVPAIPEWFPVLTRANSVGLVQGQEWLNQDFRAKLRVSNDLELCAVQEIACLDDWRSSNGLAFQYVYLSKQRIPTRDGEKYVNWPLRESMIASGRYEVVYESESREILRVKE